MPEKSETVDRETAQQVFRQFAWNLAGTLAAQRKVGTTRDTGRRSTGGKTVRK